MKLLFWNVQRLGASTPGSRNDMMENILAEAFNIYHVEIAFLCEVSGSSSFGGVAVNKQVSVRKLGRGKSAQLGYASINSDLNEHTLTEFPISKFHETFGFSTPRKGGNDFTRQSKRYVAYAGDFSGLHVYIYHANASAKAPFLVTWVAEALRIEHDEDFLLVGDLNCIPGQVKTQMDLLGVDKDLFEFGHDGATHNAKTGLVKTYDWGLGGFGVSPVVSKLDIKPTIAFVSKDPDGDMSDHLPIVVEV